MRTIHKIGIGVLVGLFFASGYAVRTTCNARQRSVALRPINIDASAEGTRVASARLSDVANVDIGPIETLYSVLKSLREHYVEQLTVETEGKMTYDAMRSMLASFNDPQTRFIEPAQRKLMTEADQGRFHGIGAILAVQQTWTSDKAKPEERTSQEHLVVVSLVPGSPAAKAGLKPGSEIVSIDGKDVLPFNPYQRVNNMLKDDKIRNMERSQLRKLLEAEQKRIDDGVGVIAAEQLLMSEGTKPIELTIAAKPPAKETKIKVDPADVTVDSVDALRMESGDTGYIKVNYFGSNTAEKFAAAMKELEAKPASGLIVDLRGATGGSIQSAEQIAGWFAPGKTLTILLKSRGRKVPIRPTAPATESPWRKPAVLLVDATTSRIPEVLAAGLKESGAAKVVGERTYGDLMDSTVIDLADGSAVLMTTGKYVTGNGVDYNGKGVPVDVQAANSAQQLKEAVKLAGGKS